MTDDELIEKAVSAAMESPQRLLRSMFRAVYTYLDTDDPAELTRFARAAAASVRAHAAPDYEKTLLDAPIRPGAAGRSIEEIFAAHAPRRT
jgi:hypothetical protein